MKMKQHMTCGIRASVITVNGASLVAAVALIITPAAGLAQTGPGYALTFAGGASHVAVNAQNVPIGNDDYTIEAWIKPDSMGNFGIIGWGSYGTTNQVNALSLRTNGLVNSWWGNDLVVTNPALAGTWHHVAATYDGVTRRIYLDGALVGTNNATGHNVTTRANLTIGRVDTNYFAGVIDEVRVWGEVRSQVQIQTNRFIRLAGNESGLNAYWRFDEGAGTAAADTAGSWNPGTLVNNPVWVRSSVTNAPEGVTSNATAITTASARLNGRVHAGNLAAKAWFQWGTTGNYGTNTPQVSFGPALPADTNTLSFEFNTVLTNLTVNTTYYYRVAVTNSVGTNYGGQGTFTTAALPAGPGCALIFDGDNDYVEFNRPIADDFTLECWFNSTQIDGNEENWYQGMGLIDGEVGGHVNDLGLTLGAGKVLFGTGGNFDTTIRSETILADGKWHHVAATRQRSSGAMLLYVDGELVASGTGSTYTLNSPVTMRLGGIAAGGNFFHGQMDEVRIWNTVRSQVQIQANLGRPLAGNESGLVAYWKLDECEGSFVADTTGHGYDGALAGAAWTNSAVPYGPFVITLAATNLTTTTAALKGSANPGAFPSTAWFQWGATTNYGNATLITNLGAGANTVALTTNISGLASFNSYHFRAVAANVYGTNYGEDQTFWLGPPIVATLPAFGITTNAATLEGDVIASGPSAQAWFQWGTNTSYGNSTALISVGTGTVPVPVTNRVSGLIAGGIYHYRVGASNSFGTTYGADRTFTNAFVAQVIALTGKDWSALAWGDFDLDGDLDIVVSGQTGPETKLYRNDGGSFAEVSIPLSDVAYGSLAVNDYDNDGWLDILLTGSDVSDSRHTEVWRNTSTGWALAASLTGVTASSAGWGDFDNDGRPDILLSGGTGGTNGIAQVWRNTGSGFVLNTSFPGLYWSSGAWGDYDNDGDLDILLAGIADGTAAGYVARLYHNNGDRTFTLVPVSLPGAGLGDATWGDYDNDGLLDILLTGIGTNGFVASVFHNEGNGTFVDINAGLIPVGYSSAAWGDFDNDGWLDIALMGLTNASESSSSAFLYQNTGTGHFTLAPSAGLISCYKGAMAVGDYDKDGRLDIATSGYPYATRIYHNYWPTTNTPPTGPANLVATVLGTNAVLAWTAGNDSRTPGAGLTYNLRVGTAPGISNIVEPLAAGNGWRRVPLLGNLNHNLSAALTGLKYGSNYYWSVQAVDTSLAGSAFECGGLFSITLAPSCSEAQLGSIMGDSAIVVASVYPNGSATSAHIQWGSTTSYGSNTSPQSLGSGYGPVALRQLLTGLQAGVLYHYRIVTSNAHGTTYGPDQTFTVDPTVKVGDSNGDGVVDQSELDDVLAGYWPTSPWLYMTNTAGLGGANVTFALTNSTAGAYSVLMSTNLNDWQYLGPATPRYEFTDTNAPAVPQRYYRLRWP